MMIIPDPDEAAGVGCLLLLCLLIAFPAAIIVRVYFPEFVDRPAPAICEKCGQSLPAEAGSVARQRHKEVRHGQ